MNFRKIKVMIGLVISIIISVGVINGLIPQILTNNINTQFIDLGILAQEYYHYGFDDYILIIDETNYGPMHPFDIAGYGPRYPGIISGNCAIIYNGFNVTGENISLSINGLFFSYGESRKTIFICDNPRIVTCGWFFGAWNTTSYTNGRYELTVYADNEEVTSVFVYIKN